MTILPARERASGRAARSMCVAARRQGVAMWGDWGIVTHRRPVPPLEVERFLQASAAPFDGLTIDLDGRGSLRMDAPLESRLPRGLLGWSGLGRLTGPHGYAFRRLRHVEVVVLPWSSYMIAVQIRTRSDRLHLHTHWAQSHYFELAHAAAEAIGHGLTVGARLTAIA